MNTELDKLQRQFDETFKDHRLTVELDTDRFKAFMLRPTQGGRLNSCMVIFSPEGIVLLGDHSPSHPGAVSTPGYGLEWFAGRNDRDYLASKFLTKGWEPDHAAANLKDYAKEYDEHAVELLELARKLEEEGLGQFDFYDELKDIDQDLLTDSSPGFAYSYVDSTKLSAIQKRFALLYAELVRNQGSNALETAVR